MNYTFLRFPNFKIKALNEDYIYNPTAIDVWVCYLGKKILVPAGQTVKI